MIRQYNPQRFRRMIRGNREYRIGTVNVGEIVKLPVLDGGRHRWIVEAWHNREYTAHHRDANGHWQSVMMAGGHLATVRRLHDNARRTIAEQYLLAATA